MNKYLAVTSVDSGALKLSDREKSDGWWTTEDAKILPGPAWAHREDRDAWNVAYSPRLSSIHGLPNETHAECRMGHDEWYVFDKLEKPQGIEIFVNWGGYRLYDPEWKWCADRFWEQMARLAPESYLGDGTVFTFATRNSELFTSLLDGLSSALNLQRQDS